MCLIRCMAFALFLCAQPQGEILNLTTPPPVTERDLTTQFAPEAMDVVILNSIDAERTEGLLKELFRHFGIRPRYTLAIYPLPGEKKPRLAFIRGKDTDVALVKKALT